MIPSWRLQEHRFFTKPGAALLLLRAHTHSHAQVYCADMIPAPLSKIAFAANAALGRHQIEFVYDDYTLKAARMPSDEVVAE